MVGLLVGTTRVGLSSLFAVSSWSSVRVHVTALQRQRLIVCMMNDTPSVNESMMVAIIIGLLLSNQEINGCHFYKNADGRHLL